MLFNGSIDLSGLRAAMDVSRHRSGWEGLHKEDGIRTSVDDALAVFRDIESCAFPHAMGCHTWMMNLLIDATSYMCGGRDPSFGWRAIGIDPQAGAQMISSGRHAISWPVFHTCMRFAFGLSRYELVGNLGSKIIDGPLPGDLHALRIATVASASCSGWHGMDWTKADLVSDESVTALYDKIRSFNSPRHMPPPPSLLLCLVDAAAWTNKGQARSDGWRMLGIPPKNGRRLTGPSSNLISFCMYHTALCFGLGLTRYASPEEYSGYPAKSRFWQT
ncbi:hypothetical protein D2T29_12600 [Sinirhodobacter populi]|uniref:Uncharacterized protein n=1 Tax=Paenirhodobacter populi TaxID=2306993 RepID=A0A443KCJ0_9RHOB|nr:hypothetical protein [Sinirhodobacter populi]RWR30504.1 hypothetical protein D2T29_12600 [Sinirhodobacter populi]